MKRFVRDAGLLALIVAAGTAGHGVTAALLGPSLARTPADESADARFETMPVLQLLRLTDRLQADEHSIIRLLEGGLEAQAATPPQVIELRSKMVSDAEWLAQEATEFSEVSETIGDTELIEKLKLSYESMLEEPIADLDLEREIAADVQQLVAAVRIAAIAFSRELYGPSAVLPDLPRPTLR